MSQPMQYCSHVKMLLLYLIVLNICLALKFKSPLSYKTSPEIKLSIVMRKPDFCICENKDADQLRSNCAADQRLCFRYTDSTIPLLPKSRISTL